MNRIHNAPMIELRHLRSLLAIADTGKLAQAATQVHLTQSALSHQVRALEAHYGVALFQRTSAGLRFTGAGQRLLELARHTLTLVADAERDLGRLKNDARGELKIALECHTCFDWLMPVMDRFRRRWPEVEIDLILVVLPVEHRLRARRRIEPAELEGETLITYPVPEERIDFIREVLKPAGIPLGRRTAELTVAILQLVASRRGIAALPNWGVRNYVELDYVVAKRIGARGLWSELHAIVPRALAAKPHIAEFASIVRRECASSLEGIELL